MKRHRLGRTDIEVSEICLGTMTWGSQNSEAEAHEQLDHAVAEGVNFIDTAEMYPATPRLAKTTGRTEEIIGSWLKQRPDRGSLVIATKVTGEGLKDIRGGARVSGETIREALEGSLKRLQTDTIDLYQLHWPNRGSYHFRRYWDYDPSRQDAENMDREIADMLGEAGRLIDEGKMRAFGLSNESAWGVMKWLEASDKHGLPRVASIQNEYSLICRLFEPDLAEVAVREDVGLLAYSPLAAGALSGKYMDGAIPPGSRRSMEAGLNGRYTEATQKAIARYAAVAQQYRLEPAQLAIAFCRSRSFMTSTIIGATSMAQLKCNLAAVNVVVNDEMAAAVGEIYREHPRPM